MAQYIDKDALVAEIKKRIKETESMQPKFDQFWAGQISAFKGVLKILDTLEVKEIGNVWHDACETPKGAGDKEIIVQFADSHASVLEIDDWEYLDHQTKWAYLKDLT